MECPRGWAVLSFLIYFTTITNVASNNVLLEGEGVTQSKDVKRDITRTKNPSKTVTYTAEVPFVSNADDRAKTFNLMPTQLPHYSQESLPLNGQSSVNAVIAPTASPTYVISNTRPSQPQVLSEQPVNGFTTYANVVPSLIAEAPRQPVNLINSPPGSEFLSGGVKYREPIVFTNGYEEGIPVNLQINVPSQNIPSPRITVVSAAPQTVTPDNSECNFSPFGFPPPFPIVKKRSRSCLKHLLPIILIALLADQDCGNMGCCPCNCGSNSDDPIPIPYPIPIPTNNPIINTSSSYSSRRRGHRDYEDYDDDNNR